MRQDRSRNRVRRVVLVRDTHCRSHRVHYGGGIGSGNIRHDVLGDCHLCGAGAALGRLALGLAILRALGMLPFLGGWISFVVVIWGMGAVALAIYKNMRPQLAAAAVAV